MDVNPINYELTFEPDLKKFVFLGTEIITVSCNKATNLIRMDCAEIKIKSCTVTSGSKTIKSTAKTDEKKEQLSIRLGEKIKGKATIHLEFQGILNDRLLGFYRSQYKQGGKTKYLATTQFEAADARRAFPCWDEPEAKATFEISIIADNKFTESQICPFNQRRNSKTKHCTNLEKHLLFQLI